MNQKTLTQTSRKALLSLAFPIMIGNLAQTLITLTDTAFLGRVSENALSASIMTGIFYFIFVTLAWGFSIGIQVIIARRLGEGKFERIGVIFEHGMAFMFPLALLLFGCMHFFTEQLLGAVIQSPNIYPLAIQYMDFRHYGIGFVCFNYLFRALYVGLSDTKPISYSTGIMAVVNISLDYVLIFGKFGFPEMGVAGAALASVCAELSTLVFFVCYSLLKLPIKKYALFTWHKLEGWLMKTIIGLSLPTMAQRLLSIGVWFLFFIMVEHMGERPIAVTGVIRSVYMLISIPAFALGVTANTVTSRLIGEGRRDEVLPTLKRTIILSMCCLSPILLLCVAYPESLLSIYTDDVSLIQDSIGSLYILGIATLALSSGVIFFEAISGLGETLHAMLLEAAVLVIYTAYIWFTAVHLNTDVMWVWGSEFIYWTCLGLFSWFYLRLRKNHTFYKNI